ncbi:MAG: DNA topoisomerase VI subunit B [Patescibacteria group bacterium]|nr:DNA topoisomerase VI subunit B [Patescibacteria group bacterium]
MVQTTVADDLANKHKSISIAEFFEKNRHLLGFDSKIKAMLTCVKEAVDNSLDACEENASELKLKKKEFELPDILVRVDLLQGETYKLIVEDNGPGIQAAIIPRVFAKLLYGSKFGRLKQGRGQQGIGISAAIMYGQLTTGKPARIISRIAKDRPAQLVELLIDIKNNDAKVIKNEEYAKFSKDTGTRVEVTLEGLYRGTGDKSIFEYLRRTSISNPHAKITFIDPEGKMTVFKRATETLPIETKEIKPHPWGLELGVLTRMIEETKKNSIQSFLTEELSKVGALNAKQILEKAKIDPKRRPDTIKTEEAVELIKELQKADLQRPPTDCLSPVGGGAIEKSLKSEYHPEYIVATTRPPNVYRGYPFQIEAALAYGGDIPENGSQVLRVANKVPLLYESGACSITISVSEMDWKRYGIPKNSGSSVPNAPIIIFVHMCSVWVPFTSESKAAIANYPIIIKEIKLALQECARQLGVFIKRKMKIKRDAQRVNTFIKYGEVLAGALAVLARKDEKEMKKMMNDVLEKKYGDVLKKKEEIMKEEAKAPAKKIVDEDAGSDEE